MEYAIGDMITYQNGERFEVGTIKKIRDDETVFVWYTTGDTAAATNVSDIKMFSQGDLLKVSNQYAFSVLYERSKILKNGGVIL